MSGIGQSEEYMITFNDFDSYVVHYTKHTDRKKFLLNQFELEQIFPNWIEKFDREELSYIEVYDQFKMSIPEYQKRNHNGYSYLLYPMKPADVSNCMKHKEAMRRFLEESTKEYMFLMEDDVILCPNFIDTLNNYLKDLPSDWDAAFIGQGANKRIDKSQMIPNVNWYLKEYPSDRCADSVLFKRDTIKKIHYGMVTHGISYPPDHELTFWFRTFNMRVYWLEPPIVAQGSQTGHFESYQDWHSKIVDPTMNVRQDLEKLMK
jgi:hypothetical protein